MPSYQQVSADRSDVPARMRRGAIVAGSFVYPDEEDSNLNDDEDSALDDFGSLCSDDPFQDSSLLVDGEEYTTPESLSEASSHAADLPRSVITEAMMRKAGEDVDFREHYFIKGLMVESFDTCVEFQQLDEEDSDSALMSAASHSSTGDSCEITYQAHLARMSPSYDSPVVEADVENQADVAEDARPDPTAEVAVALSQRRRQGAPAYKKKKLSKASAEVLTGSDNAHKTTAQRSTRSSRRSVGKEDEKYQDVTKCIRWFGHGKAWTIVAVVFAWGGTILSGFSRQSSGFAVLDKPIPMGNYVPADKIGLVRLELCYNETTSRDDEVGCISVPLRSDEVDDPMFQVARLFGAGSVVFGGFFAFFLTTAIAWETIDLRPLGFGFMLTYFFQSFTMLFFDSNLCDKHKCSVGAGCILCIASSFCWIAACIATAKMEAFKQRATLRRYRRARRRAKKALRAAEAKIAFDRKQSTITNKTTSTASSNSSSDLMEDEPESTVDTEADEVR